MKMMNWPKEEIKGSKNPTSKIPYAITLNKWKEIQVDKKKKIGKKT